MKRIIITQIFLFTLVVTAFAQGAGYKLTYDNAGNLVQRKVTVYPNPPASGRMANNNQTTKADSLPSLNVYPNPTSGNLNIDGVLPEGISQADIILCNSQGQQVIKTVHSGGQTKLDISGVGQGVYYLTVYYSNKDKRVYKIIVTQ